MTPEAIARCHRGLSALVNRGPDGARLEIGQDWVLGHTRLAILDLSDRAAQPMRDARGRWIVFNGEIYNFQELRRELEADGACFQSTGDTEVLLEALGHWGLGALTRLRGMFAFGWIDPVKRELFLVRDRYGVKPLVWEKTEDGVRFASDLFALNAMTGNGLEIDPESARQYMTLGYVPSPRTIWKGPRKLTPSHYLRVRWQEGGDVEIGEYSYWSLAEVSPSGTADDTNLGRSFCEKVREAVCLRLISDVPVGLLLSGGLDSSLVAAVCAGLPGVNVPSYTMGFADKMVDERPFARQIAQRLDLKHEEFLAEETDVATVFEEVWNGFDEPFADSSALPMLILCREMRKRVKVAIGGDGGDEVWCGYPWHRALVRAEGSFAVPLWLRRVIGQTARVAGKGWRYKGQVLAAQSRLEAWTVLKTGLTAETARFLPVAADVSPPSELFYDAARRIGKVADPLDWACRMDLATYLPDDLMVKADRASMRWGLELREPLLDHEFTSWGLSLPVGERFDPAKRQGKQLARRYLVKRLSSRMIDRPKQGFTPPLDQWLKGPLVPDVSDAIERLRRGELTPLHLPSNCKDWSDCASKLNDRYQQFLWRVVCFSKWLRHHTQLSGEVRPVSRSH